MNSRDEKKKTNINTKSEILDARVIANYGDPGLDEDYHFDILSRYLIVMIESCDRIPTTDKWLRMIAVVQRPSHLWIATTNGIASSPTTQQRADVQGNINVGLASNYSVRGISRMNRPYALGERIKIRRLPMASTAVTNPSFFQSGFQVWDANSQLYNGWHTSGATLPYINNDLQKTTYLRQKTIQNVDTTNWFFNFYLNKYQYEVFVLNNSLGNSAATNTITQIFQGTWGQGTPVYTAHGGYVFKDSFFVTMAACEYEDVNADNKMRVASNECIPLVVTTPQTFPTPKQRAVGTITYNPTYSPIAR